MPTDSKRGFPVLIRKRKHQDGNSLEVRISKRGKMTLKLKEKPEGLPEDRNSLNVLKTVSRAAVIN
jgi:hypothetical protein